jgi:hypothetical protein
MPQDQFRVFLSTVTSEFGKARDALGADLRSRDTLLRVQSDFRQEAGSDTTLKKLHDYIRDCSAVVCVIGKRSGVRRRASPICSGVHPFHAWQRGMPPFTRPMPYNTDPANDPGSAAAEI